MVSDMATKAQAFRAQQQREAHPPKPKQPRPRRDLDVDTSEPGVSASDRKAGHGSPAGRKPSKRVAKKGGARLEISATGQPSRKSTRGSAGRLKRSGNLQLKAIRSTHSAQARATRAGR